MELQPFQMELQPFQMELQPSQMELQPCQMERRMSGEMLASTLLRESTILESAMLVEEKAAEVEKSRGQAAAPFASDSATKKWAEEWSR